MKNAAPMRGRRKAAEGIGSFGYNKWRTTVIETAGTRLATRKLLVSGVRKGRTRGGVC